MTNFDTKNFTDSIALNLKNYFETVEDINKHNLNKIFGDVLSIIKQHIEINAPTIKLTRKQKRLAGKPWLTKGILISIKGALNHNFLNLTIEKKFGSRNVLIPFLNLLLLKSCKRTSSLTSTPKSS